MKLLVLAVLLVAVCWGAIDLLGLLQTPQSPAPPQHLHHLPGAGENPLPESTS